MPSDLSETLPGIFLRFPQQVCGPTLMRYKNAKVMSQDRVSVFLGVTLLNWRNTDIRNETKTMLKGDWQDCRVNHPNNRKCQNLGCLSLSWTKLPLLLLGHHGPYFITQIAFLSFLFPSFFERTLTPQDTIYQLIHLPLPEWKSCLRVL